MKKLLFLIAATSLLATTNQTFATGNHNQPPEDCDFEFTDTDYFGYSIKLSVNGTKSYTDTFNILNAGFDPATMDVHSAVASFWFKDDSYSDGEEKFDIDLGDTYIPYTSGLPISGYTKYTFNVNGSTVSLLADLQDGILSYTVEAIKGDFYFKQAQLVACANSTSVPDGGASIALLGIGLVGIFGLKRKFLSA